MPLHCSSGPVLSPRPCQQVKGAKETDKEKEKDVKDGDTISPGSGHLAVPSWVTEIRQNELFRKVRQKIDTD